MTFVYIAVSIALIAVSAACIYSIILMRDAKQVLNQIESSVKDISDKSAPLLENSGVITGKIREISENIDGEVSSVKGAVDSVVSAIDDLVEFEQKVKSRVEDPILNTAGYVAGIAKGIKAFLRVLKNQECRIDRSWRRRENNIRRGSPLCRRRHEPNGFDSRRKHSIRL
jgi:uncharacterized protein YoxC